jgi:hypothetical protein
MKGGLQIRRKTQIEGLIMSSTGTIISLSRR